MLDKFFADNPTNDHVAKALRIPYASAGTIRFRYVRGTLSDTGKSTMRIAKYMGLSPVTGTMEWEKDE
jgi:hypothetical protein